MAAAVKMIISGDIGCGKSTAVRAAMKQLGWECPAGFFTHWGGQGRGADTLYLETWSGKRQEMAKRVAQPAGAEGLPYALDRACFEAAAMAGLPGAASDRPVVIDELGVIELGAAGFAAAIATVFHGPAPALVVIQRRALDRWLEIIGPKHAPHLLQADLANRDALPGHIAALFRH